MTTILSSGFDPENGNVWRVTLVTPAETHFEVLVNLALLESEVRAVLAEGRLTSLNQYTAGAWPNRVYSVDFGFPTPPSAGEQSTMDGKVTQHNPTLHTPEQQGVIDQGVDWAALRVQAVAMITQGDNAINGIDANLVTLGTIATNVQAATTVNALKAALAPLLTVQTAILNRQRGIIENFQRVLKALRWLIPSE